MSNLLSPQDALVAVMVLMSAADRNMSENEVREISGVLETIPAFRGYDRDRLGRVSASVVDTLNAEEGLETLIGLIADATPDYLRETAYALACDVAAADGAVKPEEARLLELIRHGLKVGRLSSAAIERGARARHTRIRDE